MIKGLAQSLDAFSRVCQIPQEWSRRTPDAPALLAGATTLSYSELDSAIAATSDDLRDRGVGAGDRLLIIAENALAVPVLMFAAQRLDAWPAIVNARLARREIDALRALVEPKLCVVERQAGDTQAETAFSADCVTGFAATSFDPVAVPERVETDPARQTGLLLFTSGTTGLPKAVMLSHQALINLGFTLAEVRRVRPGGRYEGASPLSHIMGVVTLMSVATAGASLRLTPRIDIADLAFQIGSGTITHLSFVPTVYARLLEHVRRNNLDMSGAKLEYISCGGAPLDPTLKRDVEAMFRVRLVNGYGMTECAPIARTSPDRDFPHDSVGFAEPGSELRIVGVDEQEAARGAIGELWARSVGSMIGYYRNPEATNEATRGEGWIATGDLARFTDTDELQIVGRRKEMIIRSGFNVYPAEVEAAINEHPAILQSAVIGVSVADHNEEIVAFVQLRAGAAVSLEELTEHLRSRISPYKRPSRIVFRDALPIGPTGKLLKRGLAEELAQAPLNTAAT